MQAQIENIRDNIDYNNIVHTVKLLCDIMITLNGYNGEQSKTTRDLWQIVNKRTDG